MLPSPSPSPSSSFSFSNSSSNSSKNSNPEHNYLPEKNVNFISRQPFLQLTEFMTHDLITPRLILSSNASRHCGGGSGYGKTNLVVQYGYVSKDVGKYHIIRYMKMNSESSIQLEWLKFASLLNIFPATMSHMMSYNTDNNYNTTHSGNTITLSELIKLIFKRISQFRYLLIFDDVESYQNIITSLPSDIQPGQHILITSTNDGNSWPIDWNRIYVENYNSDETISYVNRFCKLNRLEVISSEENSVKLHDALSGYPLAISLSLHYIYQQSQGPKGLMTIDKFLQTFQSKSLLEKYRHLSYGPLKILYPLCDLISDAIKQSFPTSGQIIEQLSLLSDCSAVPISLFHSIPSGISTTTSPKAAQTSVPFSFPSNTASIPDETNILRPFYLYGLLRSISSLSFGGYFLTQIILCEQNLFLDTLTEPMTRLRGYREEIILERSLLPAIRKLYQLITAEEEKRYDEDRFHCIPLAGDCHLQAKHFFSILTFLERGGISSHSHGLVKRLKVMLLMILGSTLCRLGLYLDSLNQYLQIQSLLDSPEQQLSDPEIPIPLEVSLHKRIGIVYTHLKRYTDAFQSFQTYSQAIQQLFGSTHLEYEQSLLLLGQTSLITKKFPEAHGYFEQVLIYQRSIYPELHFKIAQSLHAIASVFAAQDIYVEAILLFRESLSIKKKVYPAIHSETIKTLLEIGKIYEKQKKYSQALRQFEEVYVMIQKLYSDSHPILSLILDHLGAVHKLENRLQDGLDYYQQSYQIKKRIYPENHLEIAHIMHKIAEIYQEQGKHTLALDWFQQTFNMKLMLFPEIHEEIAKTTFCIGSVYASQGKYVQALESFLNCLNTQRHLILLLKSSSSPSPSSPLPLPLPLSSPGISNSGPINNTNETMTRELGIKNHEISETLRQIGNIYQNQGRYLQAITSYEEAIELQKQLLHENSLLENNQDQLNNRNSMATTHQIMITQLMCQIGSVYKSQEKYEESLNIYQQALEIQQAIYGPIHHEIAITLSNLASIHISQGKYSESLIYLQQSLRVKKGVYPSGHQSIIMTEETIKRTENQQKLKEKILLKLNDYIENRRNESEMVSSSYSLGMVFGKEEKIQAASFIVSCIDKTGLERLGELLQSEEFQQYEKPLTNGRLGQLLKSILDEIYARENSLPTSNNVVGRSRGNTI